MISFLAHRGWWLEPAEKNSAAALRRALAAGFGVETDLRDLAGSLVIAHDPPSAAARSADDLFQPYAELHCTAPLALNIKGDGLRNFLKTRLQQGAVQNYFCFDMSVPEMLLYQREGLRFFTRVSEYETTPVLYAGAAGVWLDMFESDWAAPADITRHLAAGKQVALVSPELHRRPHLAFWERLRAAGLGAAAGLLLCTNLPQAAREFFA